MSKTPKRSAKNNEPATHLADFKGRASQILSHVLNSVAFQRYGDCCAVDDLAKQFKTTPGRLQTTLRRLEEAGLVTVKGKTLPAVYPTVKLLREQDPRLSKAAARKIIRRIERSWLPRKALAGASNRPGRSPILAL